jgi:hypothetical protein
MMHIHAHKAAATRRKFLAARLGYPRSGAIAQRFRAIGTSHHFAALQNSVANWDHSGHRASRPASSNYQFVLQLKIDKRPA